MDHEGEIMAEAKKAAKTKTEDTKEKQIKHADVIAEAVPVEAPPEVKVEIEKDAPAKAGKRSTKALRETEEKEVKEARKAEAKTDDTPKTASKPARSRLERAGKKYRESAKLVDRSKIYSLNEAIELATKTSPTKFDAAVEMHLNLGVDPKQADQNVRDTVALPAGTGKTIKIAVIAEPEDAKKAKTAGADIADADQLFADLDKEKIEFDVLICVPQMMAKLGKYARLLGPRGLMPNPKSGTVTANVATAVSEAKAGKVEYRVDQAGIVHLSIGKVSFNPAKLQQNAEAVMASLRAAKPASVKGIYLKSGYISTSMGPSIKFEV
jgi:large subunit ribosomal protein L1